LLDKLAKALDVPIHEFFRLPDWSEASTDNPQALLTPASAANAYGASYVSGPQPN
jgi:hypothetical protein